MGDTNYKTESQALNKALWDEKDAWRTAELSPDVFPQIKKTIQEDDKAEPLTETSTPCKSVIVQANANNLTPVYIGDEDVDEDCYCLQPGNSIGIDIADASLIYTYGKTGSKVAAPYTKYSE